MARISSSVLSLSLLAGILAAPLPAQNLGPVTTNQELGLKYQMPKKLKRIPLNPADAASSPHERDKWKPVDPSDWIQTRRAPCDWEITVLSFDKNPSGKDGTGPVTGKGGTEDAEKEAEKEKPEPGKPGGDAPKTKQEQHDLLKRLNQSANFEDWAKKPQPGVSDRTFQVSGSKQKKLASKLTYKIWEFREKKSMSLGPMPFVNLAAVFDFQDREVAFVASLPEEGLEKFGPIIWSAYDTVAPAGKDTGRDDTEASLYKFANTPERKEAVDKAKQGIAGFNNWDIFTTPSYICVYSFPEPSKKVKSYDFAKSLAEKLEKIRAMYKKDFPPLEGMKEPYSVFRVCTKKEEFDQYGGTSGGVVGWFNPLTKELVVFNGKSLLGTGHTETIAFHEGWHQYCDSYFGFELQRWFDEGHGDYYGSLNLVGNSWQYVTSKMRKTGLQEQVRAGTFVPIKDIVKWNKDKFYTGKAVTYYEQAYGIVDFLRRGSKFPGWKKEWENILPTYVKAALETKDAAKAVDAAFAGIDMDDFEQVWANYCKQSL